MIVWLVFHDDIGDSKYPRGVFASRDAATAHASATDPCTEHGWSEREGKDYPHLELARSGGGPDRPTDALRCYIAVRHSGVCCEVRRMVVQ
jgi:hypothetical protein